VSSRFAEIRVRVRVSANGTEPTELFWRMCTGSRVGTEVEMKTSAVSYQLRHILW